MLNYIDEYHNSKTYIKEAIKTLRVNIQFASVDDNIKTIVITSTNANEGKSTISLFLAIAMAEAGKRTLLFEADCRRPSLGNMIQKRPKISWVKTLVSDETLTKAISFTQQDNLFFLDSDPLVHNPVELIGSKKFINMMDQLKKVFDVIIIDTPPLGSFIDAALLSSQADGTIVVVSQGKSENKKVKEVMDQLKKANAKIIGVILNNVKKPKESYYYYNKKSDKNSIIADDSEKVSISEDNSE